MQNQHQQAGPASGRSTPKPTRQTNNDANLLSHPLKRLSLHTATHTPLPQSPGLHSPRNPAEPRRMPSSPNLPTNSLRRSSSVVSLNRSSSPALGRQSSVSSLRSDVPGTPSRRSSFVPNMPSPMGPKSPMHPPPQEEKAPLRACDVAEVYFGKELARHEGMVGAVNAGTIVIVHDQCYGHRFSRPKTAKGVLSLIMERPERILACVLGISAAYVRLGDRHSEGNHAPHPHHNPPERIPFKIRKTSRMVDITSPVVTNVHGSKWMGELKTLCDNAGNKLASSGKELARDMPADPGPAPRTELHSGDLYLCPESLNAFQGALGGVLDAVDAVFQGTSLGNGPSRAFVCIRPPGHHCSDDHPSGFCWLNNVHVGIEHAMTAYGVTHAAIIDFDLHHGDGSQAITWARNKKVQNMTKTTPNRKKTSIGYFSLHDINSYPCEDGDDDKVQAASLCIDNAHGQSIWNVHLKSWRTPEEFWSIYEEKYMVLLEKTRQYLRHHTNRLSSSPKHPTPKAVIFLSAGFDASEWETTDMQRHPVNVPTEFYARFTRDVVRLAEEEGTSVEGRVISVLEGGYSDRALTSGVMSHLSGLCDGQVWSDPKPSKGLAHDMHQRLGRLSMYDEEAPSESMAAEPTLVSYDPSWWHATQLSQLENLTNPAPAAPKKPRTGTPAHFSSPTQSFVAKVVDTSKISRNVNARYTSSPSRAPTPPPPEVDWRTATHALSKLLIPQDRQTQSHKPEDLAEPKVKKEKTVAPALNFVHLDPSGRQLRGRKAVASYADPGSDEEKGSQRPESRASRRQTIADFPLPTTEDPVPTRSVSRRMSVASSVSSIGERGVSREPSVASRRRSVVPAQAQTGGVAVKKARGPSAAAVARVAQRPPVPRIPSNFTNKTAALKDKENDEVDALAAGLKRVTLKLPPREEYEAREKEKAEKQKAQETLKKAPPKSTTRKAPAARTAASKPAAKPTATKKLLGRPPKSSKPPSPVETLAATPPPEAPQLQSAASAPLVQPQPIQPDAVSALVPPAERQAISFESQPVGRRPSVGLIEPPIQGKGMTPDELREQLPKPSFISVPDPRFIVSPPPRADTPPPPPPSSMPEFVHQPTQLYGAGPSSTDPVHSWEANVAKSMQRLDENVNYTSTAEFGYRPMSPPGRKQDLPVFSSNGVIPFASQTNTAATSSSEVGQHGSMQKEQDKQDIWEIQETPAR
jgi:histone deacetylase HOS3